MKYTKPVLVVHGGAGDWSKRDYEKGLTEIKKTLERGYEEFKKGSAIEAVVEAIAYMEDSGVFDAGIGSVKNSEGEVEMDAGIMHGNSWKVGAVASVKAKNPIKEALKVMLDGRHVLLVGERGERSITNFIGNNGGDTVGAVALDEQGNLVAGTSTGGISGKLPGRVGDSPIPGAGYYATPRVAVSSTGIGEIILRILPAKEVDMLVSMGFSIEDSVRAVINKITELFGKSNVGLIGIDYKGYATAYYNTVGMARGVKDKNIVRVFVFEGEI
ncbi:isoaspartyl peptidase/L-asparaginase [Sulfurisphaera tokodaii]|uniref:Plant-type L-asparaginase n=2 Tax=Sulfurisphaera tokodaii TaxID=111955 RepID=Q96ZK8_SULTO|nr:isoaspartyl peptidase/L-asparaginase [Sulfurisphaera tokodaii]BAB66917.1 putative L-asparaginase [Sulfurisphaera tokodaii str. 7]HII73862.1 arginase [Sulfurisphaera tokodaii]